MHITDNTADNLYRRVLGALLKHGHDAAPRDQATKELVGVQLRLTDLDYNIIRHPERRLNYHFMVAEWLWILLGMNQANMILPYNKNLVLFVNEWGSFDGAYGPKVVEQWAYVLQTLREDPQSRQAVINIWRERPRKSPDIPCTLSLQFLLRDNGLNLVVTMRSNDAWLGLPYDLFVFTQLQRYLAMQLGVPVGEYVHNAGSLHLYQQHWEKAQQVVALDPGAPIESPRLYSPMPKDFLASYVGVTLFGPNAGHPDEMIQWLGMLGEADYPWGSYLRLLGHRFHGRHDLLPLPWNELVHP